MKKKNTRDEQRKVVDKQIRDIWESLESHLYWMYHDSEDGRVWHARCVKNYAKQIAHLTKLL